MSSSSPSPRKKVNLALQGGGSHGAFTWGVLDRLLEEDHRLTIEGVSGTSAGAMNGAALIQGYSLNGAIGARESLDKFWAAVAQLGSIDISQNRFLTELLGEWPMDQTPWFGMADAMQRMFSPYQTNPMNINPLHAMVQDMFDMRAIQNCSPIQFFVSATDVETGRARIFTNHEITADVLMASACLPFTFHAVDIDGKPYWDGGYVGNPSLFPLIYNCQSPDVIVVQINPLRRPGTPDTSSEIVNRLNEITFNASLISEMRAIAFVQKLIERDHLKNTEATHLKHMHIHVIENEDVLRTLGASSKTNMQWDFLQKLKELGRETASAWINQNWDNLGHRNSVDIKSMYL